MKVLVVTPWFPNSRNGWPGSFIADSAIALAKAGVSVGVLVYRSWYPRGLERFVALEHQGSVVSGDFPELDFVKVVRYPSFPGMGLLALKNQLLDTVVETSLDREYRQFEPDLLHIHTELLAPAGVKLAQQWGLQSVVTLHGINTNRKYTHGASQSDRFRRSLGAAGKLVIVGEPLREYAAELAGRDDHIVCVWNGVNLPEKTRQVPDPDIEAIKMMTVGVLQEEKGIHLLLDALAAAVKRGIEHWELSIVGVGPLASRLRAQTQELGLSAHVTFLGSLPNDQVLAHLSESDVFVLPSYREAFGVAYLEAMAAGMVAVGVAGQGPSQFIEHGITGMLVPPRDARALEDCVCNLLSGPRLVWRSIAQEGTAFVRESATWQCHAEKLQAIFQTLLEESGNPGETK